MAGSGAGTTVTRWAESAVCLALAYRTKTKGKDLPMDMKVFNEMDAVVDMGKHDTKKELKLIYDWLAKNPSWYDTTIKTAKIIYDKKLRGKNEKYNFHRDSTFMNSIYGLFKENLKELNKIGLRIGGDKWNPGDIWISAEREFPTKNDLPTVKSMNSYLLEKYRKAKIIGVSLKKLGANPRYDTYNLPDQEISFKFKKVVPQTVNGTNSKDMYIEAGKNDGDIRIQIRTFDYGQDIQCEIKGKNAAGGKAGFGITSYLMKQLATETILTKETLSQWTEKQKIQEIAKNFKRAGFSQYVEGVLQKELDEKDWLDTDRLKRKAKEDAGFEQKIKDDFFVSKIQSTQIAGILNTLGQKGKADTLITALFSYAHSLGLQEMFDASVYGKVY
jgi:hypothetical protein